MTALSLETCIVTNVSSVSTIPSSCPATASLSSVGSIVISEADTGPVHFKLYGPPIDRQYRARLSADNYPTPYHNQPDPRPAAVSGRDGEFPDIFNGQGVKGQRIGQPLIIQTGCHAKFNPSGFHMHRNHRVDSHKGTADKQEGKNPSHHRLDPQKSDQFSQAGKVWWRRPPGVLWISPLIWPG